MCTCFSSSFSGKDMRKYSLVEDGCTFRYLNNVVVEISQGVLLVRNSMDALIFLCNLQEKCQTCIYIDRRLGWKWHIWGERDPMFLAL